MKLFRALLAVNLGLAIALLSGCSVKFEAGYHGQTGRDDRVITPTLYRSGITQERGADQRY